MGTADAENTDGLQQLGEMAAAKGDQHSLKGDGGAGARTAGTGSGGRKARRRSRGAVRRSRTVRFDLTEAEFGELQVAAEQAGLAKGAFAAQATLLVARGGAVTVDSPFREALGEFIRAAGLVRRIGVNLNQAVARLNATGQPSGGLLPYAAESLRRVQLLDQAAEEVRKRLRR